MIRIHLAMCDSFAVTNYNLPILQPIFQPPAISLEITKANIFAMNDFCSPILNLTKTRNTHQFSPFLFVRKVHTMLLIKNRIFGNDTMRRGERVRDRGELLISRKRGDSLTRTPRCISYARYLRELVTIHRLNVFLKMLVRDSSA